MLCAFELLEITPSGMCSGTVGCLSSLLLLFCQALDVGSLVFFEPPLEMQPLSW